MSGIVVAPSGETSAATPALADSSTAEQIELRYTNAVNALLDDAVEHESARILADVLTWTLARMIVSYGTPAVSGDILRRLGEHVGILVERRRAWEEAQQAKEEGRTPN
jgi:hypothetical protein